MEQDKEAFEKEKDSLEMKRTEQYEMIKESSKIYQEEVDRLREELKASCVTQTQLQKETNNLQEKLKCEKSDHQWKVAELQTKIELAEDNVVIRQRDFQHEREALQKRLCDLEKINSQLVLDKDKVTMEIANEVQKIEHERECLQKKLKEQENKLIEYQIQMDELRSEKEQLQENFHICQQEKDGIDKKVEEQQKDHQILMDRLREELNEANLQIQRLQKQMQHKTTDMEVFQKKKKLTDPGSKLHQTILQIDSIHRDERSSLLATVELQKRKNVKLQAELSELKKKSHALKQQLEEKSYHLSTLEAYLDESHSREDKMKSLDEENAILKKQLENNDNIQRQFEKKP